MRTNAKRPEIKALLMQDFNAKSDCPKCGNDKTVWEDTEEFGETCIRVRYCEKPGSQEACSGYESGLRHLHVTCHFCKFSWVMAVAEKMTDDENDEVPNTAHKDEPIRDFNDDCVMCDDKGVGMTFCNKPGGFPECADRVVPKEHMHVSCQVCSAAYLVKCKDHVDEPEEKEEAKEAPRKALREARGATRED